MKLNEAINLNQMNESFIRDIERRLGFERRYEVQVGDRVLFRLPSWMTDIIEFEIMGISGRPLFIVAGSFTGLVSREFIAPIVRDVMLSRKYPEFRRIKSEIRNLDTNRFMGDVNDNELRDSIKKIVEDIHEMTNKVINDPTLEEKQKASVSQAAATLYEKLRLLQRTSNLGLPTRRKN